MALALGLAASRAEGGSAGYPEGGEVAALLRAAAETAIAGGEECITPDVLARAAYRGPAERRQAVERELA